MCLCLVSRAEECGVEGFRFGRDRMRVSHLLFAVDTIFLFISASKECIHNLKFLLLGWCMSGIIFLKSIFYVVPCDFQTHFNGDHLKLLS